MAIATYLTELASSIWMKVISKPSLDCLVRQTKPGDSGALSFPPLLSEKSFVPLSVAETSSLWQDRKTNFSPFLDTLSHFWAQNLHPTPQTGWLYESHRRGQSASFKHRHAFPHFSTGWSWFTLLICQQDQEQSQNISELGPSPNPAPASWRSPLPRPQPP